MPNYEWVVRRPGKENLIYSDPDHISDEILTHVGPLTRGYWLGMKLYQDYDFGEGIVVMKRLDGRVI